MDQLPSDNQRTGWLMRYEPWLKLLARLEIESRLQAKFSPSDAVQQTLLEAWRDWDNFRGESDAQRMAWLRAILAHQLARLERHFARAKKRDVSREVSIQQSLDRSSLRLDHMLAADDDSPSGQAQRREQQLQLVEVLDRLPDDYRQVLVLRHLEDLPHEAIARRLNRSEGAVRMLWVRALARLRKEMSA